MRASEFSKKLQLMEYQTRAANGFIAGREYEGREKCVSQSIPSSVNDDNAS